MNLDLKIKYFIQNIFEQNNLLKNVIDQLHIAGGTCVLVGGAVRDLLLGYVNKDLDIEIYGLEISKVEQILGRFGHLQQVGKAFGVYLVPGLNIDWSLPRTDSVGRKPIVDINPQLDFKSAFKRRDLTINAMGINLKTGALIDPFNGVQDLSTKTLRYVDRDLFIQDPLRFYRVMQFIGRLEMLPDQNLNDLCSKMDLSAVSLERIESEFNKLFLKSASPSLGLDWLRQINRLHEILPELAQTIGIEQDLVWHPEGDVFEHTKQVLDCAARQDYSADQEKLMIMWAALCHDLGKTSTTKLVDGKLRSIGHAQVGALLAKDLLARVTNHQDLIKAVSVLVRYHMDPLMIINNQASLVAYKKLAYKLYPYTIELLLKLVLADRTGRKALKLSLPIKLNLNSDIKLQEFANQAKLAGVFDQIEAPVLQGRDLLDVLKPGPKLGEILMQAYLIQLQEGILDKHELKNKVLKNR